MSSKPYFDLVAQDWDQMRAGFFSDAVRDRAIAASGVQPGSNGGRCGRGTGFITEGPIQKGLRAISIDQSPAMLEVRRRKFALCQTVDYRL